MTPQHPLDLITRGVPSLQAWWDEYRAEDGYDPGVPRFHMGEFTLHILEQAQGGVIPNFDSIAGRRALGRDWTLGYRGFA